MIHDIYIHSLIFFFLSMIYLYIYHTIIKNIQCIYLSIILVASYTITASCYCHSTLL